MKLAPKQIKFLNDFLQQLCAEETIKLKTNFSKNSWYDPTTFAIYVETDFNLTNLTKTGNAVRTGK